MSRTRKTNLTHGGSYTVEYQTWKGIRRRCQNPNSPIFRSYGGRGITVDPSWETFEQFLADMGTRPSSRHSIERIDNDGPYAPWNCRWATRREQTRNTRSNVSLTYNGETMVLMDWAKKIGMHHNTLSARLTKGWSVERALTTPNQRSLHSQRIEHGESGES